MRKLIRELRNEIQKEASKSEFDAEKLIDLLTSYQILKRHQSGGDEEAKDHIPKLSELDIKIIEYIGNNGRLTLKNIYTDLVESKSTVSYRIDKLVEKGILIRVPTVLKGTPIDLTDRGKEILSMIKDDMLRWTD